MLWPEDVEESSGFRLLNMFWLGGFDDTNDPYPFYATSVRVSDGSDADTEFVFWFPIRIMDSFFATSSAFLTTRYPASRMGRQLPGS